MAQQVFKITDGNKVKLLGSREGYNQLKSITIANLDSGDANITLYLASQVGDDITDSGTDANEADNSATTSSVTLTVDGTAATSDTFLNEQVFNQTELYLELVQLEIVIQKLFLEVGFLKH